MPHLFHPPPSFLTLPSLYLSTSRQTAANLSRTRPSSLHHASKIPRTYTPRSLGMPARQSFCSLTPHTRPNPRRPRVEQQREPSFEHTTSVSGIRATQQTRGMKVRSSVKKLCDGCKVPTLCFAFPSTFSSYLSLNTIHGTLS